MYPASFVESDIAVKEGEAFLLEGSYTGESVNIFGKKYNVVRREDVGSSWFGQEYRDYVLYQCSEQLEPFEVFSLKYDDKVTAVYDWLFDYYFRYSLEYCRSIPTNDPLIWAGGDSGDILWLISVLEREKMFDTLGVDAETVYEMYLYVSQFGDLPSSANENWVEFSKKSRAGELSQMLEEYRSYVLDYSSGYCSFALSDGEYANLAYGSGENGAVALGNSDHYVGIAMAVYTDGSKEAAQFLASAFGGNLMDKKDVFNEQIRYEQVDFIALLTAIGVMLALICLCVYFMMRSTLMNPYQRGGDTSGHRRVFQESRFQVLGRDAGAGDLYRGAGPAAEHFCHNMELRRYRVVYSVLSAVVAFGIDVRYSGSCMLWLGHTPVARTFA